MVIEEQKDTLESTESSLEKQEENIQDVTAVESELEEYAVNTNDISEIEKKSDKILMYGFNHRHHDSIKHMKKIN